jgi:hypothetical protein
LEGFIDIYINKFSKEAHFSSFGDAAIVEAGDDTQIMLSSTTSATTFAVTAGLLGERFKT